MNLTDIYKTFHQTAVENTFFSSLHATFLRKDYMLGDKTSFNKVNKIEIIPSIFSKHNGIKLENNRRGEIGKFTDI